MCAAGWSCRLRWWPAGGAVTPVSAVLGAAEEEEVRWDVGSFAEDDGDHVESNQEISPFCLAFHVSLLTFVHA